MNKLLDIIPSCHICLNKTLECFIICKNGHFLCENCIDEINPNQFKNCAICRTKMLNTPIINRWNIEFEDNLKNQIQKESKFNIGDNCDFFYNDEWNHGKIININLLNKSYEIESTNYLEKNINILLSEEDKITKEYKFTKNWRNFNFLSTCDFVYIYICNHLLNGEICYLECQSEKNWIESRIVYFCNESNYVLCVFSKFDNSANSVWQSINSKYMKLC